MKVLLNGRLVDESAARVSVFDRGFLYGDGLFETLVVWNGHPFRWEQHWERLQAGAAALHLRLPGTSGQFQGQARRLIEANRPANTVLRLAVSRGVGPRGYSPKGADTPAWVMSLHPLPRLKSGQPERWTLRTASCKLCGNDPLARFKTANKLLQIVARCEAEAAGATEALLLNERNEVAEAASGNIFWLQNRVLATPPPRAGALPGITRDVVFDLARQFGLEPAELDAKPAELTRMDAVFLTLSTLGVVAVIAVDGQRIRSSPIVNQLHAAYWRKVANECSAAATKLLQLHPVEIRRAVGGGGVQESILRRR
jgi:branched-chain amino acid aminotransferase